MIKFSCLENQEVIEIIISTVGHAGQIESESSSRNRAGDDRRGKVQSASRFADAQNHKARRGDKRQTRHRAVVGRISDIEFAGDGSAFRPRSDAYVVDDPNSQWMVQAAAGPITAASIGAGADVAATPVPNTTMGTSGMVLGTPTTTATLPFKVVNLVTTPPGVNGRDVATQFNLVVVAFNNQIYKALLGV